MAVGETRCLIRLIESRQGRSEGAIGLLARLLQPTLPVPVRPHLKRAAALLAVLGPGLLAGGVKWKILLPGTNDLAIRTPHELPALGYHCEMRKHPADPDGPNVEAIVWAIPVQLAIYSLDIHSFDTGLGMSVGLIRGKWK